MFSLSESQYKSANERNEKCINPVCVYLSCLWLVYWVSIKCLLFLCFWSIQGWIFSYRGHDFADFYGKDEVMISWQYEVILGWQPCYPQHCPQITVIIISFWLLNTRHKVHKSVCACRGWDLVGGDGKEYSPCTQLRFLYSLLYDNENTNFPIFHSNHVYFSW